MERNVARFISGPDLPRGFDRFVADASAAEAGSFDRFVADAPAAEAGSVDRFVADASAAEAGGHNQSVRLLVASWLAAERLWGGADGSLHRLRSAHA